MKKTDAALSRRASLFFRLLRALFLSLDSQAMFPPADGRAAADGGGDQVS